MNRRKRLFLLLFALCLVLVAAVFVLVDRLGTPVEGDRTSSTPRSELTISNFRHTATEKGRVLWTLEADRAEYRRNARIVDLSTVKIDYIQEDGTKVTATSARGVANMTNHDLELTGAVTVASPDYTVKSDHLQYNAENKTFLSPGKTFISGEGFHVEADSAEYEMVSGLLFLTGNAKGELHESL